MRNDPQANGWGAGRETGKYGRFLGQVQIEPELQRLGLGQHAVFDLEQLREIGLTSSAVHKRAALGRLHRIHHRVYSLVPRELLTRDGHFMAAVLACRPRSALSHRSAGLLQDLAGTSRSLIDVTIQGRSGRSHPGIDIHRSTRLTGDDVTEISGIPCTTVARTLFDLAEVLRRRPLERAFDQAEAMGVFDLLAIEDQIARNPNRVAASRVRALLNDHYVGSSVTDSDFEEVLFPLLRAASLPLPQTRFYIDPDDGEPAIRRDFIWPDRRLDVETDSKKYHGTVQAFERDRYNDQRLALAGWRVIRITWRQLEADPRRVIALIASLLNC